VNLRSRGARRLPRAGPPCLPPPRRTGNHGHFSPLGTNSFPQDVPCEHGLPRLSDTGYPLFTLSRTTYQMQKGFQRALKSADLPNGQPHFELEDSLIVSLNLDLFLTQMYGTFGHNREVCTNLIFPSIRVLRQLIPVLLPVQSSTRLGGFRYSPRLADQKVLVAPKNFSPETRTAAKGFVQTSAPPGCPFSNSHCLPVSAAGLVRFGFF